MGALGGPPLNEGVPAGNGDERTMDKADVACAVGR